MARTIAEIYDALNQVKGNMSELGVYVNNDAQSVDTAKKLVNDVRNTSRVAIWRLWLWIVAVGSWVIENYMDAHEAKINAIIAADKPHTLNWYAAESKKFQYGYEITWLNDHFGYAATDVLSQIVMYSAAIENIGGGVTIKVLKAARIPLTIQELDALKSFWARWKDAGVNLDVISNGVNNTWFSADIYRNRNIVNADNTLIADPAVNVVTDPANAYINSVEFNGTIYYLQLMQDIMNQPGIANAVLTSAQVDEGTWGAAGSWTLIPLSGFASIDWLACTITYHDVYE